MKIAFFCTLLVSAFVLVGCEPAADKTPTTPTSTNTTPAAKAPAAPAAPAAAATTNK